MSSKPWRRFTQPRPFTSMVSLPGQLIDPATANFLATDGPAPSQQDIDELARHTSLIVVQVRSYRTADGDSVPNRELARLETAESRLTFLDSVRLHAVQEQCMALSMPTYQILFFGTGEVGESSQLETIDITWGGSALRWDGWHGDGCLEDPMALLHWFADLGHAEPLKWRLESQEQHRRDRIRYDLWIAAAPECFRIGYDGKFNAHDVVELERALELLASSVPDPAGRIRHLLKWHGAVEPIYSGYPSNEAFPAALLMKFEAAAIVEVLQVAAPHSQVMRGAIRLFLSWSFPRQMKRAKFARLVRDIIIPLRETAKGLEDTSFEERVQKLLPEANS